MNTDIDDGLSPFGGRRSRNNRRAYRDVDMDDYSPSRRPRRSRTPSRGYDYGDETNNIASPNYRSPSSGRRGYDTSRSTPVSASSGSRTTDDYDDYFDDTGYEDYGELGSNYDITKEPNYGYDDPERYEAYKRHKARTSASERKAPSTLDFSNTQPARRTPSTPVRNRATAPNRLDFSGARTPTNTSRGDRQNSDDLAKYLDYLERYDKGDLDNHDMGRIQRAYANKPFWQTFNPSRDLIEKYGSGNRSTRWPMFRREGNRWVPEVWRND